MTVFNGPGNDRLATSLEVNLGHELGIAVTGGSAYGAVEWKNVMRELYFPDTTRVDHADRY